MDADAKSRGVLRVVLLSRDPSPGTELPSSEPALQLVPVRSAYEAAAEILAAPTLALVIDLGAMPRRHLRLIQVARQMEVEMLAFGRLLPDLSTEDISGVRLISRRDLSEALHRLAAPAKASAAPEVPPPPERPAVPAEKTAPPAPIEALEEFLEQSELAPAEAVRLTPAKQPADRPAKQPADRPPKQPPDRAGKKPAERPGKKPADRPAEGPADAPAAPPETAPPQAVRADDEPAPSAVRTISRPQSPPQSLALDRLLSPEELAALLENEP